MNSQQYEELCRFAIAGLLKIDINQIKSVYVPSPVLPSLQTYKHQIDLYWEADNELVRYITIANAKWRSTAKVNQEDVSLLDYVKQQINAHKAMMITSTDFTAGAKAVAETKGVALLIVRPNFNYQNFPERDRSAMQTQLFDHSTTYATKPIYIYNIECRGLDFSFPSPSSSPRQERKPKPDHPNKMITGQGVSQKIVNKSQTRIITPSRTEQRIMPATKGPSRPIRPINSPKSRVSPPRKGSNSLKK